MDDKEILRALGDEIITYVNTRRDKKEEAFLKASSKTNKSGVVTNGAIIERMLIIVRRLYKKEDNIENIKRSRKAREQAALEYQQNKYKSLIDLVDGDSDEELLKLKNEYQEFVRDNSNEHQTKVWLDAWAKRASDISFATHVAKLTHSSSKGSSILDNSVTKKYRYLTTNQLTAAEIDTASSNAASLPISDILKLTVNGVSVLDCLKNKKHNFFKQITDDTKVINDWCNQLCQSYDSATKQSYFLSKQIYFPTEGQQYHLLMPLTSSSLVHALYLEHKKYWNPDQVDARKQKKLKHYSPTVTCTYPKKAYLNVTASNHSNASSLNGKRGGRISLLPTAPPQWQSRLPSYFNKSSIFDKTLAFELKDVINELKNYLLLIKNKSLSTSEPKRNTAIVNKLQAISSQFFNYLETINANELVEGWTVGSKLPPEQQMIFEPRREDVSAKAMKINTQWQKIVSQTYGRWLNQQLTQKGKLKPTAIHAALWADYFLLELREIVATQEATL